MVRNRKVLHWPNSRTDKEMICGPIVKTSIAYCGVVEIGAQTMHNEERITLLCGFNEIIVR